MLIDESRGRLSESVLFIPQLIPAPRGSSWLDSGGATLAEGGGGGSRPHGSLLGASSSQCILPEAPAPPGAPHTSFPFLGALSIKPLSFVIVFVFVFVLIKE